MATLLVRWSGLTHSAPQPIITLGPNTVFIVVPQDVSSNIFSSLCRRNRKWHNFNNGINLSETCIFSEFFIYWLNFDDMNHSLNKTAYIAGECRPLGILTGFTAVPENIGVRLAVDILLNIAVIIKKKNMWITIWSFNHSFWFRDLIVWWFWRM